MKYKTAKKLGIFTNKIIDISLFPLRCICQPIYKIHTKRKSERQYSKKTICKLAQYLLDYWCDREDEFYLLIDEKPDSFDYSNVKTIFGMVNDMGWYRNKSIKKKIQHLYFYQKEMFISIIKELAGTAMTNEEKKKWFEGYSYYDIKEHEICKLR